MEVLQIFGLRDQEIYSWFRNHKPLIPTLRNNVRAPIQFIIQKDNPSILKYDFSSRKDRPIHFHVNKSSVIRLIKQNHLLFFQHWYQQATSCPSPCFFVDHSSSEANSSCCNRSDVWSLILESSIINIDINFTDNIVRKIINA